MEAPIKTLFLDVSEADLIEGLKSLLPFLIAHWNQPLPFRRAATPAFMRQINIPRADAAKALSTVELARRQTLQLWRPHLRPLKDQASLENAYNAMVPALEDSPLRQGTLWLAFQIQKTGIDFLLSPQGEALKETMVKMVETHQNAFQRLEEDSESIPLAKIETILATMASKTQQTEVDAFQMGMLTGYIVEVCRWVFRMNEGEKIMFSGMITEEMRMLASLFVPVRKAELLEANNRFSRMKEEDKKRYFDQLQDFLKSHARGLAKIAVNSYEMFCQTVENRLFSYPAQLEWLRVYLKTLYGNAWQSTFFDNCNTEISIHQRYRAICAQEGKSALVEIARALALHRIDRLYRQEQEQLLEEFDLVQELHWPESMEALKMQIKNP